MSRMSNMSLCTSALAAASNSFSPSKAAKVRVTSTRFHFDPYAPRVMPPTPPAVADADAVSNLVAAFRGLCTPVRAMKAGNVTGTASAMPSSSSSSSASSEFAESNFFAAPAAPIVVAAPPQPAHVQLPANMPALQHWIQLTAMLAAQAQLVSAPVAAPVAQQPQQMQQPMMMQPQPQPPVVMQQLQQPMQPMQPAQKTMLTSDFFEPVCGAQLGASAASTILPMASHPASRSASQAPLMNSTFNASQTSNDFFDSTTFASGSNMSSGADVLTGVDGMSCLTMSSASAAATTAPTTASSSPKPEVDHWVTVRFKHEACVYRAPFRVNVGDTVFVQADRGEHCGVVTSIATEKPRFNVPNCVVRRAGAESMEALQRLRAREQSTGASVQKLAESISIGIRVRDVEFQADGHKLTIFFESKSFVDFRKLQRMLFREHKCRIWLVNWDEMDRVMQPARE